MSKNDFKFIVFEGVDASGKSTLAKGLAEKIKGTYYYTPPTILHSIRDFADSSSPIVRYHYYLLGVYIAIDEIRKLLQRQHVIADWYIFATLAYHSVLLNTKLELPKDLLLPDYVIYLTANWDVIDSRLESRTHRSKYEELLFLKKVHKQYLRLFKNLDQVIYLDTESLTVDENIDKILRLIF